MIPTDEQPDDLEAMLLLSALGVVLSLAVISMVPAEALHWMTSLGAPRH